MHGVPSRVLAPQRGLSFSRASGMLITIAASLLELSIVKGLCLQAQAFNGGAGMPVSDDRMTRFSQACYPNYTLTRGSLLRPRGEGPPPTPDRSTATGLFFRTTTRGWPGWRSETSDGPTCRSIFRPAIGVPRSKTKASKGPCRRGKPRFSAFTDRRVAQRVVFEF